jgi:hypothetical protein
VKPGDETERQRRAAPKNPEQHDEQARTRAKRTVGHHNHAPDEACDGAEWDHPQAP